MASTVSFHAACRFFSHTVWDVDRLGLLAVRLIIERLQATLRRLRSHARSHASEAGATSQRHRAFCLSPSGSRLVSQVGIGRRVRLGRCRVLTAVVTGSQQFDGDR